MSPSQRTEQQPQSPAAEPNPPAPMVPAADLQPASSTAAPSPDADDGANDRSGLSITVAADGFPTGQDTPEGAACDLVRAFINSDVALLKRTCLTRYGTGDNRRSYDEFLSRIVTGTQEDAQRQTPHPGNPKQIGKVFAARHLTMNGPASYGYAVLGFHDVQFVDVGTFLHDGSRFLNRTLVVKKADGTWRVHPCPTIDPLISHGLNQEPDSTEDFTAKYTTP